MTELLWDGKYDANGKKVAPPRITLPFQTVETVNESAADRNRVLNLFAEGKPTEWRNRLIWGDKKYVLPSLLPEFAGKVALIYIDPPFDTGANFSYMATVPDDPNTPGDQSATFTKEPSVIEQKAYRDTWGKGLDSYLKWFYETVVLLRELLADNGSIYVHLDWHVGHYAKAILDEVFGISNFRNEVIWYYPDYLQGNVTRGFPRKNDFIFIYSKSDGFVFNRVKEPLGKTVKRNKVFWNKQTQKLDIVRDEHGKIVYQDYDEKFCDSVWQIGQTAVTREHSEEFLSYPTQKPIELLRRVVEASSNEGDLVLDCFCGSGTTAAVAEKLGRRWITCDLGRFAIHTARKRLLGIANVTPFVVQNLGKYERQAWQTAEFGEKAAEVTHAYRSFILDLYRAQPLAGYVWLHGVKNGRMVHVGDVGAPVSVGDVAQIVAEFKRLTGTGKDAPGQASIDILGWDFAFEVNEVAKQQAALAGVTIRPIRIPREVLEKKAVEQGDIKFFELAALSVDVQTKQKTVTLQLTDFVIPLDDVPADIQRAITHWEQWIDYWAVDWDNQGDTFHNQWQSYRTRKDKTLQKQIVSPPGTYPDPGDYKIVVKVIDILGNDTTKTLTVKVS